ncbi:hypothetical protein L249_0230 [Ophiocordyceps polyrhachis-furcata BCC 54312]|uniref:CENP-V/GFA domain-containing protein n=1 Tax=Ophiocordyceps polyrhachis-furcata BCC 54312 TaxID=1330021 RepID=A0A367LG01_9HYPO|nr:hypothetical protein L249_0230 [Ophiocordyceps polyrhachis-furcata BCC 54312]
MSHAVQASLAYRPQLLLRSFPKPHSFKALLLRSLPVYLSASSQIHACLLISFFSDPFLSPFPWLHHAATIIYGSGPPALYSAPEATSFFSSHEFSSDPFLSPFPWLYHALPPEATSFFSSHEYECNFNSCLCNMAFLERVLLLGLAAVSSAKIALREDVLASIPPYPIKLGAVEWTPQMIASKLEQDEDQGADIPWFANVDVTGSRRKAFDIRDPLVEVDLSETHVDDEAGQYRAVISNYTNKLIGIVQQSTKNYKTRNTVLLDVAREKLAGKYLNGGSLGETITLTDGTTLDRAVLGDLVVNGPRRRSARRLGDDYIVPLPRTDGRPSMALVFNQAQTDVIRLVKVKHRVPLIYTQHHVILWTPTPTKQAPGLHESGPSGEPELAPASSIGKPWRPRPSSPPSTGTSRNPHPSSATFALSVRKPQPSSPNLSAGASTSSQPHSDSSAGASSPPNLQQTCRSANLPCDLDGVPGWAVTLKPGLTDSQAQKHIDWVNQLPTTREPSGAQGIYKYGRFRGYAGNFNDDAAKQIKSRPEVDLIIPNGLRPTALMAHQNDSSWNLESLIPPAVGPGYKYHSQAGEGMFAYILDTGINSRHTDFGDRVTDNRCFAPAPDCESPGPVPGKSNLDIDRQDGHGTAVASVLGGRRLGVAKKVSIIDVRIYSRYFCSQRRTTRVFAPDSAILQALSWVVADVEAKGRQRKSVINFSTGHSIYRPEHSTGYACMQSQSVESFFKTAYDSGILPIASSGNDGIPGEWSREKNSKFLNVGAHDNSLTEAGFSNHGHAVDILAPGVQVVAADAAMEAGGTKFVSGTSVAAPHVAGLAVYLMAQGKVDGPQSVMNAILEMASCDVNVLTANVFGVLQGTARQSPTRRQRLFNDGNYGSEPWKQGTLPQPPYGIYVEYRVPTYLLVPPLFFFYLIFFFTMTGGGQPTGSASRTRPCVQCQNRTLIINLSHDDAPSPPPLLLLLLPLTPKPMAEATQTTKTLEAECHCGKVHLAFDVPVSQLPLRVYLCHCSKCRYGTGSLCIFHTVITRDGPPRFLGHSTEANLTSYLAPGATYSYDFCSTCGCHVAGVSQDRKFWTVASSIFKDHGPGTFQIRQHVFSESAKGGGLSSVVSRVAGDAMNSWNPAADESTAQLVECEPETAPDGTQRLRAQCWCGGVSFTVSRPTSEVVEDAYMSRFVSPLDGRKWKAVLDSCDDCRRVTGTHLTGWAFVPLAVCDPAIGVDLAIGTAKTYASSEGVLRSFCRVCGATVFFSSKKRQPSERQAVVDLAVGILRAPEGVMAEHWLTWRARPAHVGSGLAFDADFTEALTGGMKAWTEEKYGEAVEFDTM